MPIWIRSQDKETLCEVSYIDTQECANAGKLEEYGIVGGVSAHIYDLLGYYATEERADEVIDEIQHFIEGEVKEITMFEGKPLSKWTEEEFAAYYKKNRDDLSFQYNDPLRQYYNSNDLNQKAARLEKIKEEILGKMKAKDFFKWVSEGNRPTVFDMPKE